MGVVVLSSSGVVEPPLRQVSPGECRGADGADSVIDTGISDLIYVVPVRTSSLRTILQPGREYIPCGRRAER